MRRLLRRQLTRLRHLQDASAAGCEFRRCQWEKAMMHRAQRSIATLVAALSVLIAAALATPASAQNSDGNDLRDIRLGMAAKDLPDAGYVNLACAANPQKSLTAWSGWRDCPADPSGFHAIKFGYDPSTSRDGTIVAGHPAILTLLVDDAGIVSGLRIET